MYLVVIALNSYLWSSLNFLDAYFYLFIFSKLGKSSAIIFKYSLYTFLSLHLQGSPMCVLVHLIVSHRSFRLSSLFFNLFSFCSSNLIIYIVLSSSLLIFSFAGWNLPLNPSSEFLISFIVLFSSRISFWFLSRFYYFLIDSSILLIHCFLDFLHIFLCSLSIFKGGLFV